MLSIPLILTVKHDTFNRQNKRSIRLEFIGPRHGPDHDGVHYTVWMTPGQVELWEKTHNRPLAVGTRFDLALNPTNTGENNASNTENTESTAELPETRS